MTTTTTTRDRDPFGPWRLLDDHDTRWRAEHQPTGYRLMIARDPITPADAARILATVSAQRWCDLAALGGLVRLLDEVAGLRALGTGRTRDLRVVRAGWSHAKVRQWRAAYAEQLAFDDITRGLEGER